jgi:hypothetical protein
MNESFRRWCLLLCANLVTSVATYLLAYAAMVVMGMKGSPVIHIQWLFFGSMIFFSALQIWLSKKVELYVEDAGVRHFALAGFIVAIPALFLALLLAPVLWMFVSVLFYAVLCNATFGYFLKRFSRHC